MKPRAKHAHPPLAIPYTKKDIYHQGDHGSVINGRVYTYHPTKGWRNNSLRRINFGSLAR